MKILVCTIGKRMPDWVQAGWHEYARRMPREITLDLLEIRAEARNQGRTAAQLMAAEAQRIEAALPQQAWRIALDERGQELSTRSLAQQLQGWQESARDVAFIIGGPDGLDPQLKNTADQTIRISALTLPHPMVRIILAEQLYRAWSILAGHPYHRE